MYSQMWLNAAKVFGTVRQTQALWAIAQVDFFSELLWGIGSPDKGKRNDRGRDLIVPDEKDRAWLLAKKLP